MQAGARPQRRRGAFAHHHDLVGLKGFFRRFLPVGGERGQRSGQGPQPARNTGQPSPIHIFGRCALQRAGRAFRHQRHGPHLSQPPGHRQTVRVIGDDNDPGADLQGIFQHVSRPLRREHGAPQHPGRLLVGLPGIPVGQIAQAFRIQVMNLGINSRLAEGVLVWLRPQAAAHHHPGHSLFLGLLGETGGALAGMRGDGHQRSDPGEPLRIRPQFSLARTHQHAPAFLSHRLRSFIWVRHMARGGPHRRFAIHLIHL